MYSHRKSIGKFEFGVHPANALTLTRRSVVGTQLCQTDTYLRNSFCPSGLRSDLKALAINLNMITNTNIQKTRCVCNGYTSGPSLK